MKKYIIIMIFLLSILLTGCGNIKMKKGAEDYIGKDYEQIVGEFEQLGFRDIETIEIADLTSYGEIPDGTVSEVSIDGNTAFSPKAVFAKDTKVLITYHSIKKLPSPISYGEISGIDYTAIADAFTNAGFINVQMKEVYDLDPDETRVEYQNEVRIDDIALSIGSDVYPFDAPIDVICHHPYKKYELQLKVGFIGNLFFNKYDVDLLIDEDRKATLKHGKDWGGTLKLKGGSHTIKFVNTEDSSVNGETVLDIAYSTEVEYQIFCRENEIAVDIVYLNEEKELKDNETKILCSETDYLGRNYKEVVKELTKLGFSNIKTVPVYDIYWGVTQAESISGLSISGANRYNRGDVFLKDTEVIISYHMPQEEDPSNKPTESETVMKESEEDLQEIEYANMNEQAVGNTCTHVRELMEQLEYTAEYEHEYSHDDFTGIITYYSDEELDSVGFVVTGIKEIDAGEKTVTFYVNTVENMEQIENQKKLKMILEKNFDPSVAVSAMEQYGKKQYPYGFSISMAIGRIAETPIDENTWFMKYNCKFTNAFGEKISATCEAKIRGPESNPTVYDFNVY